MDKEVANWIEFWDHQTVMDDKSWRKNAELLIEGSQSFFPLGAEDKVLDIGSGPGFVADIVSGRVKSICCVDTSERYIEEGKARFSGKKNVTFNLLGEDYLDFSFLGSNKFNKILCASVIQYYRDLGEVEKLITEMGKVAEPGAKILIADISVEQSPIKDLFGLLTTAWRKKYLWSVISFIFKSFGGDYSRLRKGQGLLTIKKSDLDKIVKEHNLKAEWRSDVLTLNKSRRHLLIQF